MSSPSGEIRVVRAQPHQAPLLTRIAVEAKAHWKYSAAWLEQWAPLLTIAPSRIVQDQIFCAEVDGKVVGFYALAKHRNKGHLQHLWVLPAFMGRGVGRALFEHAIEQGRDCGFEAILLESDPNAAGFYLRMGAHRLGTVTSELEGVDRELPVFAYELR
jgi:ribosomal protein S18 acetylase RimI-like enzyme